jgi:uncharacterized membrane protein YeaQ/YmgE (transglycosylase-associated protein family)
MTESKDAASKRKRGTLTGLAAIALGIIGSIVMYVVDSNSMDFFRIGHASDMAIIHAVLWGFVGLVIILWHNREPPDPTRNEDGGTMR